MCRGEGGELTFYATVRSCSEVYVMSCMIVWVTGYLSQIGLSSPLSTSPVMLQMRFFTHLLYIIICYNLIVVLQFPFALLLLTFFLYPSGNCRGSLVVEGYGNHWPSPQVISATYVKDLKYHIP